MNPFKGIKKKLDNFFFTYDYNIGVELVSKNSLVDNIYAACTCCYDYKNDNNNIDYFEKVKYIGKRISAGHTSILEHGYLSMVIYNIPANMSSYIIECMNSYGSEYLYTQCVEDPDIINNEYDTVYNLLISGSIRGYNHFLDRNPNMDNPLVRRIIETIRSNVPIELFKNIDTYKLEEIESLFGCFVDIESNIFAYHNTTNEIAYDFIIKRHIDEYPDELDKAVVIGISNCVKIKESLLRYGFEFDSINKTIPITILFENMSRTSTHQLVRHRNAITQESQRYVNYSKASFTVPGTITNKDVIEKMKSIAESNIEAYNDLIKDSSCKKEEARAILPSNVNCNKIYMTFTLSSMYKFLELRTDKHAQHEIRMYANKILEELNKILI